MKIEISEIKCIKDASLKIDITETVKGLENITDFQFEDINFKGTVENSDGVMKLNGHLKAGYSAKCFRCLEEVTDIIELNIREIYSNTNVQGYEDAYLYEDDYIEIDDALKDNIILNLPMKKVCADDCKGLCSRCGKNFNTGKCDCKHEEIDPRLEKLNNYFK